MLKKSLLAALLLSLSAGAFAQSTAPATPANAQTAPALTAQQKAQLEKQNTEMAKAALGIAQKIDARQTGEVWDQASSVAKQANNRADFVKQVNADRTQLGALTSRKLLGISRTQSKGGTLPVGLYINVSHAVQFANSKEPVRELISYHLDGDNIWRLAGYTVR